jgi:hypothetical protein
VSPAATAALLGRGQAPRPDMPRSMDFDPGPMTAIVYHEGPEIIASALVSLYAVPIWRPNLPRETWWRLGEAYADRVKEAAREVYAADRMPTRVAVEAMNPPAPHVRRKGVESGPPSKQMIELLYVVQHMIGVIHGMHFKLDRKPGHAVTVPPGGHRGEWHKPQYGGTGTRADHYPKSLLGSVKSHVVLDDGPAVAARWDKQSRAMHHLREAFDVGTDAETIIRKGAL